MGYADSNVYRLEMTAEISAIVFLCIFFRVVIA